MRATILAAIAASAIAVSAQATTFKFSYSVPASGGSTGFSVDAMGKITATATGAGNEFLVTGISGTWNGVAITSLLAPNSFGGNDNLIYTADPKLTDNGLAFTVNGAGDQGDGRVNVYYTPGSGYSEFSPNVDYTSTFNLTEVVATPEAASFGVLGLGVASLVLARRRRAVTN